MIYNYISLKQILDDALDHPLLRDVSLERAINHTVHFIRIVGCPSMFLQKCTTIDIEDYRGTLPEDCNSIIQVRTKPINNGRYEVFRSSTDSFHMSDDKQKLSDLTYKIQGGVIYTSIKRGTIEISYEAFNVDDEGYPLIPDNSAFIRALELYLKKQYFTVLFDLGKINQAVYQNVQQEYAWAVGQAQSELVKPSIDEMQSITNQLNTLLLRVNEHRTGFVDLGTKEKLKI